MGKKPTGRHTPEVAAEICRRIAEGESLRSVCSDEHMPTTSTVALWVVEDREGFSDKYARARQAQATLLADELFDIADDGRNDTYIGREGAEVTDHEVIQRSRLRVDTRKWYLSKVLPKVYGDAVKLEHTGAGGGPVEVAVTRRIIPAGASS
jgi:hypothetical protein